MVLYFEEKEVNTLNYSVFRMKEADDQEENIQQIKFFLSKKKKLIQIRFIEKKGKKTVWGYLDQSEWNFDEFGEKELIEVFRFFALHNPQNFQSLYQTLKGNDPRVFACIQKARKEVAKLFHFN